MDARSPASQNAAETHCARHAKPLEPANLYLEKEEISIRRLHSSAESDFIRLFISQFTYVRNSSFKPFFFHFPTAIVPHEFESTDGTWHSIAERAASSIVSSHSKWNCEIHYIFFFLFLFLNLYLFVVRDWIRASRTFVVFGTRRRHRHWHLESILVFFFISSLPPYRRRPSIYLRVNYAPHLCTACNISIFRIQKRKWRDAHAT